MEYLIEKFLLKSKITICDCSAAVTGLLLALNLPAAAPWWVIVIGSIVAIGIAKMTFGGLGQNLFNPALVGRVFLLVSFPAIMASWTAPAPWGGEVDAFTGATPLGLIKEGLMSGKTVQEIIAANPNLSTGQLLFARAGGSAGEISALALLLGFGYLLARVVLKLFPGTEPSARTKDVFLVCGMTFGVMFFVQPFLAALVWNWIV